MDLHMDIFYGIHGFNAVVFCTERAQSYALPMREKRKKA
jgi:hypothetical protein